MSSICRFVAFLITATFIAISIIFNYFKIYVKYQYTYRKREYIEKEE